MSTKLGLKVEKVGSVKSKNLRGDRRSLEGFNNKEPDVGLSAAALVRDEFGKTEPELGIATVETQDGIIKALFDSMPWFPLALNSRQSWPASWTGTRTYRSHNLKSVSVEEIGDR